MYLRQAGFIYSPCGFIRKTTRIQRKQQIFKATKDSIYIYRDELDKAKQDNMIWHIDI